MPQQLTLRIARSFTHRILLLNTPRPPNTTHQPAPSPLPPTVRVPPKCGIHPRLAAFPCPPGQKFQPDSSPCGAENQTRERYTPTHPPPASTQKKRSAARWARHLFVRLPAFRGERSFP